MRKCKTCKDGIGELDGTTPYVVCALLPPEPVVAPDKLVWVRPQMAPIGWCGQYRFGVWRFIRRLVGYGARA